MTVGFCAQKWQLPLAHLIRYIKYFFFLMSRTWFITFRPPKPHYEAYCPCFINDRWNQTTVCALSFMLRRAKALMLTYERGRPAR